jgi:hypothetical protein
VIRSRLPILLAALVALLALPTAAHADFGIDPETLGFSFENADGTIAGQAGSHPYVFKVDFELNLDGEGKPEGGELRDVIVDLPPGWVANPQAVPRCPHQLFEGGTPQCPFGTQVGVLHANVVGLGQAFGPIYNLVPPPGVPAQLGFSIINLNAFLDGSVKTEEGYKLSSLTANNPINITGAHVEIWGTPADPGHDTDRGRGLPGEPLRPSEAPRLPFLTMPANCSAPLEYTIEVDSKQNPGQFVSATANSLDAGGKPAALQGCDAVPFAPKIAASTTSRLAESPSGLDFELKLPNRGLLAPGAIAEAEPSKAVVTLPEGVTVNPSAAEGIGVCTPAQYKAEQIDTEPGQGCPEASKLGSIVGHSPLTDEPLEGALYLAKPFDNPSGSLIGLYIVARVQERGVLIKQAGKVEPDPKTGQLITTFENLPPLPYSDFKLHFREGGRAPLVSPPSCGSFQTVAKLTPFSAPSQPFTATASFTIEHGVDGGPCPQGGTPPFEPGFEAGSNNNNAKSFSPFYMRLTRRDGDQDLTRFSAKLPPGMLAKLAGTTQCPDSAVAIAKAKTGLQEQASPSCPASSQIGRVLAGAGVGSVLTYVPGKVYLAGPYNGAPLSVIGIVPAVAGPFDVGTVATRQALQIDPRTAEVRVDDASSDPIPHILAGIPLKVRDIRVYVDKPNFTLNPTSCEPFSVGASLFGGGADVFSSLDDSPISLSDRFQAANCANLGFKPRLSLKLKGGTKRGAHPALTGIFRPREGDANLKGLVLRLPRSAFLDQAHIRTICTRVQFAANGGNGGGCPSGAIYGRAKAFSPLISEPLEGPVYLRSSSHNLPDFVAALHGIIDVEAVARIDSKNGGIRATFSDTPDAPLSKVIVNMQGGKKGLIVNSRNLCGAVSKANAEFSGHNGRRFEARPVVGAECGKGAREHH